MLMKSFALIGLLASVMFAATDPPKLGWKQTGSETFSLNVSQPRYYLLSHPGRWRFEFKADTAISTGVATAGQFGRVSGKYLTLRDFNSFSCVKTSILEAAVECVVREPNSRLAIRDERGPMTRAEGAISAVEPKTGSSGASITDRATRPNKVTVTVYEWSCIENCTQAAPYGRLPEPGQ
jgi:hypothetical protein